MAEDNRAKVDGDSSSAPTRDYSGLTDAVRELADVMRQGDLEQIEVTHGDLHIMLSARTATPPPGPAPAASSEPVVQAAPAAGDSDAADQTFHHITSPMVGTFYEAPSPGEPPFIRPGDSVEVGQTVAIIEAMKIMNEIVADRPGVVDAVLVENGEAVEFGHPLFRLRPA